MSKREMEFDEKKALAVFGAINKLWQQKKGIFTNYTLPEDRYPAIENPREFANWLFFSALPMRGGVISDDPFKWMWELKKQYSEIFEPQIVAYSWTPEKIQLAFKRVTSAILNGNGIGKIGGGSLSYKMAEHARNWHENASILTRYWGDDIRNVFWGVTEFEEAFRRIDYYHNKAGFKGMRRKIFSLLTAWLQKKELIPFFPFPVPVDIHFLRICSATEIAHLFRLAKTFVPKEKHAQQLAGKLALRIFEGYTDAIAKWSQKFLYEHGFSSADINPAVWILSRTLCAQHLQNSSRAEGTLYYEADELRQNPYLWPKDYKDPCLSCPIEQWCKWAIPVAPYYRWGLLVRMSKRVPYSEVRNRLPFDWQNIPYVNTKKRP